VCNGRAGQQYSVKAEANGEEKWRRTKEEKKKVPKGMATVIHLFLGGAFFFFSFFFY